MRLENHTEPTDLLDAEWLSEAQVADLLGYSVGTVRQWRQRGQGPRYYKHGPRVIRYLRSDVDRWLRASVQE